MSEPLQNEMRRDAGVSDTAPQHQLAEQLEQANPVSGSRSISTADRDEATSAVIEGKGQQTKRTGRMQLYVRRFKRNKPAVAGLFIFLLLVLFAIFGPLISPWNYKGDQDFTAIGEPPSATHWFGTDWGGNDLFAQVAHGIGRSLIIALTVSFFQVLIAAFIGAWAAYAGGRAEKVVLAIIHFLMAVPTFLLLALIGSKAGGDWKVLILVLIIFGWMYSSRVIWSLSTSIREREFVTAAKYMGVRGPTLVFRHMIPNIGSLLVLQFTLGIVGVIMTETGLSFLGFGVQIPDVSLGVLLQDGVNNVVSAPWAFASAAIPLTLLTVSMALVNDGLRDALDPNSAAGGKA